MKLDRTPGSRRSGTTIVVIIAVVLAAIILPAIALVAVGLLRDVTTQLNRVMGSETAETFVPKITLAQVEPWQGKERLNVLLLGIDQRPNETPEQSRTDTILVLTLDPATRTAGMMSIPRDLYVPLPNRGAQERINTAHVYGGPSYAMQTVEYNFGIPMQHYVRVNFNALVTLVDLVGGIDIYVDEDINDPSFPDNAYGFDPFYITAGWHHMDGVTAMKYARTRHGASDFFRMRRQQQVIMALRDRVLSTDAIAKLLPNAPQILLTLQSSISTDFTPGEIVQLILFARNLPTENISRVVVDETAVQSWTTPQGGSVLIPVRERIRELREELYNPPPPEQVQVNATPEAGRIIVHNGTNTQGLAATAQAKLQEKGFTVVELGNAQGDHPKTVIIDYHGRKQYIAQLANALGVPATAVMTQLDNANPVDALVILGDDYQPK